MTSNCQAELETAPPQQLVVELTPATSVRTTGLPSLESIVPTVMLDFAHLLE